MSDLLALSELLRAKAAEGIANYLRGNEHVTDLLDLAKALLTKRELEKRIRSLSAQDLRDLESGQVTASLQDHLLASEKVFEDARSLASQLQPISLQTPQEQGHGAGLSAYQTLLAMTELLFSFEKRLINPVKAGLRAPDAREIGDTLKLSGQQVQVVYQLGLSCGFIHQATDRIHATKAGFDWLELDNKERWLELATKVTDFPELDLDDRPILVQLQTAFPLIDPNQYLLLDSARFCDSPRIKNQPPSFPRLMVIG